MRFRKINKNIFFYPDCHIWLRKSTTKYVKSLLWSVPANKMAREKGRETTAGGDLYCAKQVLVHPVPLFEHYVAINEPRCASIVGSTWVAVNYGLQQCGGTLPLWATHPLHLLSQPISLVPCAASYISHMCFPMAYEKTRKYLCSVRVNQKSWWPFYC